MECAPVQLKDLPDEILIIIFQKLSNSALLYSLTGVNKRFNRLVHDSIFTNRLTLVRFERQHLFKESSLRKLLVYPLIDRVLDRFCLQILPEIHYKVQWLCLEPLSMKRILCATDYPNLSALSLWNIEAGDAINLFSDETIFTSLKSRICSLSIDTDTNGEIRPGRTISEALFTYILLTFSNLRTLNLNASALWHQHLCFDMLPPSVMSSILLELHVCTFSFNDCLRFLDGRFSQLRIFDVKIDSMPASSPNIIDNKTKLTSLKSFTLCCHESFSCYEELILPLLHRMSNLEKLDLSLAVSVKQTFTDGNELKLNILNHLPLLKKFSFNIRSLVHFVNQTNFATNDDIQRTLKGFPSEEIFSSLDHFPHNGFSQCHIYSCPYKLDYFHNLTNRFPGGFFQYVYAVTLLDEQPFEHAFFLRIAQSFPFLELLTVINRKRQNERRLKNTKDSKRSFSAIEYPHLHRLNLMEAHQDYHGQFLFDTKSSFPNGLHVTMDYQFTRKVTRNFRRNSTRSNCAKISFISFYRKLSYPAHMKDYFPFADIF